MPAYAQQPAGIGNDDQGARCTVVVDYRAQRTHPVRPVVDQDTGITLAVDRYGTGNGIERCRAARRELAYRTVEMLDHAPVAFDSGHSGILDQAHVRIQQRRDGPRPAPTDGMDQPVGRTPCGRDIATFGMTYLAERGFHDAKNIIAWPDRVKKTMKNRPMQ